MYLRTSKLPVCFSVLSLSTVSWGQCPLNLIAKNVQRDHSSPYPPVHQVEIWFEPIEGRKAEAIKGLLHGPTKDEAEQNGATKDESFAFQITNDPPHPLRMATVDTGSLTKVRWLEILEIQFTSGRKWHASSDSQCRLDSVGTTPYLGK